jgi:hypothetical protein
MVSIQRHLGFSDRSDRDRRCGTVLLPDLIPLPDCRIDMRRYGSAVHREDEGRLVLAVRVVYLEHADKSDRPVRRRHRGVTKEMFSLTPGVPPLTVFPLHWV